MSRVNTLLRLELLVAAAVIGWFVVAIVFRLPPPPLALWIGLVALGLVSSFLLYRWGYYGWLYHRVQAPVWSDEFPATTVRIKPGGQFDWHPRGEHRIQARHGVVQHWWDDREAPRFDTKLEFEIPDEVEPAVLQRATKKALSAAKRALPSRGKVRASAAHRDDQGPTSTVKVRLVVQGIGAEPAWARAAIEAFGERFLDELAGRGFSALARR